LDTKDIKDWDKIDTQVVSRYFLRTYDNGGQWIERLLNHKENEQFVNHTLLSPHPDFRSILQISNITYKNPLNGELTTVSQTEVFPVYTMSISDFLKNNPLYYGESPDLTKVQCSINWNINQCSSKEYGHTCRTCAHYNPFEILKRIVKEDMTCNIPIDVLFVDLEEALRRNV